MHPRSAPARGENHWEFTRQWHHKFFCVSVFHIPLDDCCVHIVRFQTERCSETCHSLLKKCANVWSQIACACSQNIFIEIFTRHTLHGWTLNTIPWLGKFSCSQRPTASRPTDRPTDQRKAQDKNAFIVYTRVNKYFVRVCVFAVGWSWDRWSHLSTIFISNSFILCAIWNWTRCE